MSNYFLNRVVFFGFFVSLIFILATCSKEEPLIPPSIQNQEFSVFENSVTGTSIGVVTIEGFNSGESISFAIVSGNTNEAFEIDILSGELKINNSESINYEVFKEFTLKVSVTSSLDENVKSEGTVVVEVMDVFEITDKEYSVYEKSPSQTRIGYIGGVGSNPDETVSYEIVEGNINDAFEIDILSGELKINNSESINYEDFREFTLKVVVTSSLAENVKSEASIIINVLDVFDITDQEFSVEEISPTNTFVGEVAGMGSNPDESVSFAILDGNINDAFNIGIESGIIVIKKAAAIDFELIEQFVMTVRVMTSLGPELYSDATVTINVLDSPNLQEVIAHYPFEGNAQDASANGLNGVLKGNIIGSDDRFGNPESAYYFDGNGSYIDLGNNQLLNLPDYATYSISFWMKPEETGFSSERVILSKYNSSANNRIYKVGIRADLGDKVIHRLYDQGTATSEVVTGGYNLDWQHIVIVTDVTTIKIYADNIKTDEIPRTLLMRKSSLTDTFIGAVVLSSTAPDLYFKGWLDDVILYQSALTNEEITTLFEATE